MSHRCIANRELARVQETLVEELCLGCRHEASTLLPSNSSICALFSVALLRGDRLGTHAVVFTEGPVLSLLHPASAFIFRRPFPRSTLATLMHVRAYSTWSTCETVGPSAFSRSGLATRGPGSRSRESDVSQTWRCGNAQPMDMRRSNPLFTRSTVHCTNIAMDASGRAHGHNAQRSCWTGSAAGYLLQLRSSSEVLTLGWKGRLGLTEGSLSLHAQLL
ncbi:hypothetical protein B0H67DRAFT_361047 [Lasiosphaeris hirsuta]|uniref:Uncharacterized protein n=1 Tax=Lasiosphaeris hirsuta TaxID=260670 RepID=A0AA40DIW0_9PEZI|nr:hypothetical protein B0H67DRAFT_361047 [Lasiosphaeris hirsuta]